MSTDYYQSKQCVDEYIEVAKNVNSASLIEKLKKFLSPSSNLLELGSGPGTDWSILNEKYVVVGSDNSEAFIEHLASKYPQGHFLNLDAITLSTELKFDGIYSNKVLHHLNNEELNKSVERQAEVLNRSGIVGHSFWKGKGSEYFKGMFVNYHTEEDLRSHFESHFDILLLEQYKEFEKNDSLLLIARKI